MTYIKNVRMAVSRMTWTELNTHTHLSLNLNSHPKFSSKNDLYRGLKLWIVQISLFFVSLRKSWVFLNWSLDIESTLSKSVFVSFCSFVRNKMPSCIRSQRPSLIGSSADQEKKAPEQLAWLRTIQNVEVMDDIHPLERDKNTRSISEQVKAI